MIHSPAYPPVTPSSPHRTSRNGSRFSNQLQNHFSFGALNQRKLSRASFESFSVVAQLERSYAAPRSNGVAIVPSMGSEVVVGSSKNNCAIDFQQRLPIHGRLFQRSDSPWTSHIASPPRTGRRSRCHQSIGCLDLLARYSWCRPVCSRANWKAKDASSRVALRGNENRYRPRKLPRPPM